MLARFLAVAILFALGCSEQHHPDNFSSGAIHGPALKVQTEDCRECHGEDLTGGTSGVSCDGCHSGASSTAWRGNCVFCHGGVENETGAPPRNLDGTDIVGPFPAHTVHVTGSAIASAYDCNQCHTKANDVLSPGHVFDDTPGHAENDYGAGLSPRAAFSRETGECSNAYCHGSGRADDGTVLAVAGPMPCNGCHPTQESGAAGWGNMSGPHAVHMGSPNVTCASCHSPTTADGTTIASKDLHINGLRDVTISEAGFQYDPATARCTGTCHNYAHTNLVWIGPGGGGYHPPGYSAASVHGPEMELQRKDCRGCHGANLEGAIGQSCDNCHSATMPMAWRSDCTFCHGGGLDTTGAPPRDLGSSIVNSAQSFVGHRKHVAPAMMSANDCTTCHVKPTDVMSTGHAFDTSPQASEVNLTLDGRNPAGAYAAAMGTCSNLYCHGNGRTNGTATDGNGPMTCLSCHGGQGNRTNLSTNHRDHHNSYACNECHLAVIASGSTTLTDPSLHINKVKDVKFLAAGFTMTGGLCTGSCHGEGHTNERW